MFVWTVKSSFDQITEERKKEEFASTRPVGFAAGKNFKIKDHEHQNDLYQRPRSSE